VSTLDVDIVRRARSVATLELDRAWRSRTTWIIAGAMVGVAVLVTLGAIHQGAHGSVLATPAGASPTTAPAPASLPPPVQELRNALSGVAALRLFVVLIGILCVTTEYQHGDVVWRWLAEPSRAVLVAGKAVACALVGALLGVLTLQVATVIELGFGGAGATIGLRAGEAVHTVAGSVLVASLAGVMGVGIGAAVRNQTAAVVGTLVAALVVEPVLSAVVPVVSAYLPSPAAAAAAGRAGALGWIGGLAVSCGYAAAAVLVGGALSARRDL
jgi:hypothetical protein